ncbi:Terpene synthase, metal-binding [Pseudomonas fluorescens]|uniref:Isopentenyl-diphosphate Delta-isomerase n=2 Tax=Pseudomonas fluorescens TaxID=294 RepID=A0A3S4PTL2_PSEFL|nr:family 2 encapsulin nanocompartment cargo protein terpene cyclase [Pseudomonas fluorescens]VEF10239.1 Terpene synthase, metal-binding [Pseudomonas fluorescens]
MDDLLILVSSKDRQIGVAPKLQVHHEGLRHRAFSILLFDPQGRLLLQQRASGKYHSGGLWTNTCCGHPRPGELTAAAARRRLHEEMGMTCKLQKVASMLYHEQVSNQLVEHEFDHVFIGVSQTDPQINPEEAQDWEWLSLQEIAERIEHRPDIFTVWFRRMVEHFGIESMQEWFEAVRSSANPSSAQRSGVRKKSPWAVPALYALAPFRIDAALTAEVDDRLLPWIAEVGIFPGQHDKVRAMGFGRFAMLCHTDTDDPDRLLLAAQCFAALFAVDDYYCDDERTGSEPRMVGPRLSLALAALEPVYLSEQFQPGLELALHSDPVLVALRAYLTRVECLATAAQVARVRHEIIAMFVTMTAEAAWRIEGLTPALWEYLAHRQVNSFLPCLSLIDIIGGYELPANVYSAPDVRRITALAASATIIANDLFSALKEQQAGIGDFNLPLLLIREQGCSPAEAMMQSAAVHDQIMHLYEAAERAVLPHASPLLKRYLHGIKSWLAGNLEWHRTSGRYQV